MKRFLITGGLLLASPIVSHAQDNNSPAPQPSPTTKLEAFSSKKGLLLVRDFYKPGLIARSRKGDKVSINVLGSRGEMYGANSPNYISYAEITAVMVYEPAKEGTKVEGLNVDITNLRGPTVDSNRSTLDIEEAESLSQALDYLVGLSDKWKGQNVGNKEAYFETKDDLRVTISQQGTESPTFEITSGRTGATTMQLVDAENLTQLKTLVDKGIEWLKKQ